MLLLQTNGQVRLRGGAHIKVGTDFHNRFDITPDKRSPCEVEIDVEEFRHALPFLELLRCFRPREMPEGDRSKYWCGIFTLCVGPYTGWADHEASSPVGGRDRFEAKGPPCVCRCATLGVRVLWGLSNVRTEHKS